MKISNLTREAVPFLEIFITSLIILMAIAINRGIMYEHDLKTMEYPKGYTAIGISVNPMGWHSSDDIDKPLRDILNSKPGIMTRFMDYYNEISTDEYIALSKEMMKKIDENLKDVQVIGTVSGYFDSFKPRLLTGRYFTGSEESTNVCVIGENLAKHLFGTVNNSMGQSIELPYLDYRRPFGSSVKVIGVLAGSEKLPARAIGMSNQPVETVNVYSDDIVIMPFKMVYGMFDNVFNTIWIDKDVNEGNKLSSELSKSYKSLYFTVNPSLATFFKSSLSERAALYILNAFVVLLFLVSGMGIMGIQLITVGRRREEIGLEMALGARKRNIASMIIRGTMARFIAPSAAGILAGFYAVQRVSKILDIPILVDITTMLIFAVVMFLFAACIGLYPAIKAASLDPVSAMDRTPGFN